MIEVGPDPLRSWVAPLGEAGEAGGPACDCANAGAATPTVRMAAEAAPPSKIRQLYTKHSISMWVMESSAIREFTWPGRIDLEPG